MQVVKIQKSLETSNLRKLKVASTRISVDIATSEKQPASSSTKPTLEKYKKYTFKNNLKVDNDDVKPQNSCVRQLETVIGPL
jgi:hypothetical protein